MPEALFEQLKVDGVLIAPLGQGMDKVMTKYTKQSKSEFKKEEFGIFHFVPFVEEGN
ncbi:MAG: Protein-L-isoaspartate O-methyltransferase [Candidatus Woesebacteria bacterium GW2011_GWA1_37_7]|uniref:Protein-L-isoaspartate O-methyltransferase n=1 Tax=Candidatus Woesebacteria bacterium GW2011_GWA1_37_7 TaxID=1618545 RepID=A0A0G0K8M5_9BACT|nr:MAG: Protein-L-isoaspartate O-methyltransferase [Candidatus Woesebacteria bacterium GW2011_GWA1_37_7]